MKFSRTTFIVASVVVFHLAALWAFHQGLLQRMVEVVVPVMAISQTEPPPPLKPPEPPDPPKPVEPPKPVSLTPPPKTVQPVLTPAPPVASPEPPAVLSAPTAAATAPAVQAAPPAPPPPPPAPPVSMPAPLVSSTAPASAKGEVFLDANACANNPPPIQSRMSKRLQEQGKVVLNILLSPEGIPQRVELHTSSGFERLDKAAIDTVTKWRCEPARRSGIPEAQWGLLPIVFISN